jgi:protein-S-isoprenylcysteine O-methyltransferase Ste14
MKKIYLSLLLILFFTLEGFSQDSIDTYTKNTIVRNGIGLGSVIAAITSWERNKSVLWAILSGIFSWFYVIYYVITRKKEERK